MTESEYDQMDEYIRRQLAKETITDADLDWIAEHVVEYPKDRLSVKGTLQSIGKLLEKVYSIDR